MTDPTSGFFAADARAVRFLAAHDAPNYPEVDAVVRLARSGFHVCEVPILMWERAGDIWSIRRLARLAYIVKAPVAIVVSWLDTRRAGGRDDQR